MQATWKTLRTNPDFYPMLLPVMCIGAVAGRPHRHPVTWHCRPPTDQESLISPKNLGYPGTRANNVGWAVVDDGFPIS